MHLTVPNKPINAKWLVNAIQSIGAAIQNMLLVAYNLGLDAGWMCAPLLCPEVVCDTLSLDKRLIPQAMIIVGYATADPKGRAVPIEQPGNIRGVEDAFN